MDNSSTSIADTYRILSTLGSQNTRKFGKVFLVENKQNQMRAVLKTLVKSTTNNHLQDRLRREASFSFEADGLPKTLAFNETDQEILLVKSWQDGITLDEYWVKVPKKERTKELIILLQAMVPLFETLNSSNTVHCDLKPSNILVHRIQEETHVSIIDFGLAQRIPVREHFPMLFPLGFAAPELLLNKLELIDHKTDLYALGIIIWRLFAGRLPLTHPNPSVFTNLQITHPLPDHEDLPKGIYPILLKMCAKHQFKTAPNLLNEDEVLTSLGEGMDQRFTNLKEVVDVLKEIPTKKRWLFF